MIRALFAGVLTLGILVGPAIAQPQSALGQRVRLTFKPQPHVRAASVVGRLVEATGDTLSVDKGDRAVAVPLAKVERLEISRGQRSHQVVGALAGGLGGGLLLGAIAASTYEPCTGWCILHFSQSELFVMGALAGGAGGLLLGAIIGSGIKVDTWEPLLLRPSIGFHGASPGLTLSVSF